MNANYQFATLAPRYYVSFLVMSLSLSLPRSSLINDGLAANLRGDDSSLITSDFITAADGAVYTREVRAFGGIGDWLVCPRCERFCYVRFVYGSMFRMGDNAGLITMMKGGNGRGCRYIFVTNGCGYWWRNI